MGYLINIYEMNLANNKGNYYDIAILNDLNEAIQESIGGIWDYEASRWIVEKLDQSTNKQYSNE